MAHSSLSLRSRNVLRGLTLGFVLVLLLLGASGWVAVRRSRAISQNVAKLARDHLIIARLIHEIQATQNAMTEVLQRIVQPGQEPPASTLLLGNLEESTQQLTQLSEEVRAMAGSPLWLELESTMKSFSDDIRQVLYATDPASPAQIQDLFNQNNRMISQVNELIRRSSDRLAEAELEIQDQSDKLRRNSTSLLGTSLVLAIGCAAATILFVRQSIDRLKWQSSELDRVS